MAAKTQDRLDVSAPPVIRAENLGFRTAGKSLIEDVSFSLDAGEILAVIGPNGAGKSTLLKCLAGELTPTAGAILAHGRPLDPARQSAAARWRAVLPQANRIPFAFTAREIVLLGRSPHILGRESPRDQEIVGEALAATDATHLAARSVQTLSGGELQRVHMARVLAQIWEADPGRGRLLLLDEPTAALDLKHQHALLRLARDWADHGTAVLVILHDLNLAARHADSLLWIHQGRQTAFGSPETSLTPRRIREVFGVDAEVLRHKPNGLWIHIRE
jgi:iron complex transport system ATP-binding protein